MLAKSENSMEKKNKKKKKKKQKLTSKMKILLMNSSGSQIKGLSGFVETWPLVSYAEFDTA